MIYSRDFFRRIRSERMQFRSAAVRDAEGRIHAGLYTDFFTRYAQQMFCTNSMYAQFRSELLSTVEMYDPKERVVVTVFDSDDLEEEDRELALMGFRRYVGACYAGRLRQMMLQLCLFTAFLVVGVALVLFLHALRPSFLPEWAEYLLDAVSGVFIWQFVGYFAFEFSGNRKDLRQLERMRDLEYEFRHWE